MAALAVGPKNAQTYRETGSIRKTARRWHTTRQVVRRWVRRYQAEGEAGLNDPRTPAGTARVRRSRPRCKSCEGRPVMALTGWP
jgi:transposase-like protein